MPKANVYRAVGLENTDVRELRRQMQTLLEFRFGSLPPAVKAAIEAADGDGLLDIVDCAAAVKSSSELAIRLARLSLDEPEGTRLFKTRADVHRAEGAEEGRLNGLRQALIEVLEAKFGPLSPNALASIRGADQEQLSPWIRSAGTAESLSEVGIGVG